MPERKLPLKSIILHVCLNEPVNSFFETTQSVENGWQKDEQKAIALVFSIVPGSESPRFWGKFSDKDTVWGGFSRGFAGSGQRTYRRICCREPCGFSRRKA